MCQSLGNERKPFVLPKIWEDDDAMYSLMQPIRRPRNVDPINYDTKVTFWKKLLLAYAKDQKVFIISENSIQTAFSRRFPDDGLDLSPQCLYEVLSELVGEGHIQLDIPPQNIINNVLKATFTYLIQKPISWTYKYFSGDAGSVNPSHSSDQKYVFYNYMVDAAEEFLNQFHKKYNDKSLLPHLSVFELECFKVALESYFPHTATRECVWNFLEFTKQCISVDSVATSDMVKPIQIIRIGDNVNNKPEKLKSSELETLSGTIRLKSAVHKLETDIENLEFSIKERRKQIKSLLGEKRLMEAKKLLRRTKILEKSLEQKHTQLQNLETLELDIESATQNRHLVSVLKDANQALKITSGGSDGLAKVENIVNDALDNIEESREITDIITQFGHNLDKFEDSNELEEELNDLISDARAESKPNDVSRKSVDESSDLEAQLGSLKLIDQAFKNLPKLNPEESIERRQKPEIYQLK